MKSSAHHISGMIHNARPLHHHQSLSSLSSPKRWLWFSLCLSLVMIPTAVRGQNPPTALPPTPQPPTIQPPTAIPPTPIPPTPQPPTPIPPTTVAPTPIPTTPPPPHTGDNTRFYLIEIRISCSGTYSSLSSRDFLSRRVKDIVDLFLKNSGQYSGIRVMQFYKVVGEPLLIAVVRGGLNNSQQGISSINKLGEQLCGLGAHISVTSLTSFEAFARAVGAGVTLTHPPAPKQIHSTVGIHCYVLEYVPRATTTAATGRDQLRQLVTFLLQKRQAGEKFEAYKFLAKTNVEFFICGNTVLSDFDRMFLDLWTLTDQPDVTSVKAVHEVQSVDVYLNPGNGGKECKGFWCRPSYW
ncbi:uncharacterized protein [Littorina saxatilis]